MKRMPLGLALLFCAAGMSAQDDARAAALSYFPRQRAVRITDAQRQNYVAIDDDVWEHARADLADLRFYDGSGAEVPYALIREGGDTSQVKLPARMFNLVKGPHGAEFLLEISPAEGSAREYDRVKLDLSATDFVGNAKVEGSDDVSSAKWAEVGTYPIFDLSADHLGSHFELKLPTSRFRFLRVVLLAPVGPEKVKGASILEHEARTAAWAAVGTPPQLVLQTGGKAAIVPADPMGRLARERGRFSFAQWTAPERAPLDRITFDVSGKTNFRRKVEVQDDRARILASGEIWRIHLERHGQRVDSEQLELPVFGASAKQFALIIYNGDDPPLPITAIHQQSIERRAYFDPQNHADLKLYYGDEKTRAPVYDYAKLFQAETGAARAELGPEERNAAYTGRPDDRPWSDRHPAVLWTALIIVIVLLGAVALRGMKS